MWDRPKVFVEQTRESPKGDRYSQLLFLAHNIFSDVSYWKPFLLGHAKYSSVSHWSPVKPIRGEPDNLSPSLESIFSDGVGDSKLSRPLRATFSTVTWYTLEELKNIDSHKRMGLPKNPTVDTRGVTFEVKADGKIISCHGLTNIIDNRALNQSFDEPLEINFNENDKELLKSESAGYGSVKEYIGQRWENKFDEEPPQRITVRGKGRKIKSWCYDFEEFLEFLEEVRTNEELGWMRTYEEGSPDREDIRIIVAV